MDIRGFEKIKQVMEDAQLGRVDIEPELQEGEDVRFVTIRPRGYIRPAIVLNALDNAGLVNHDDQPVDPEVTTDPVLKVLGIDAFGVTFEDINRC